MLSSAILTPGLIIVTPSPLPQAIVGQPYDQFLLAQNDAPPDLWSVTAGALYPGLTLLATGEITGTPDVPLLRVTNDGSYRVTGDGALRVVFA